MSQATLFDIQRFSIHDGPGIRTLLFFKGCSFKCSWCQNPEGIRPKIEMGFKFHKCVECHQCFEVCEYNAINKFSQLRINWDNCTNCGKCSLVCPSNAIEQIGNHHGVSDLIHECLKDKEFYEESYGGITLSGGEPVLHSNFLKDFLPEVKKLNIHTVMETAGNYPFSKLSVLLPYLNSIFIDLKLPNEKSYKTNTGSSNKNVLNNINNLNKINFPFQVRIPIIPGINSNSEDILGFSKTLNELKIYNVHLLKYNSFWEAKLDHIHTKQKPLNISTKDIHYETIVNEFKKNNINAELIQ